MCRTALLQISESLIDLDTKEQEMTMTQEVARKSRTMNETSKQKKVVMMEMMQLSMEYIPLKELLPL